MDKKKTAIFHEAFLHQGEAERMNISLATILQSDIVTSIWSIHSYIPEDLGYHGKSFEIFGDYHTGWFGWIRMKLKFILSWKVLNTYERIVFSNETLSAVHFVKKGTETIYYAHSLPYFLFDGKKDYVRTIPFFYHEFYHIALFLRKWLYIWDVRTVKKVATNSLHNKQLLQKWTKRQDIDVIYPPVNMLRYRPTKKKIPYIMPVHSNVESLIEKEIYDYYVSSVRVTKKKQVDKIVHAFVHMPEKNLIVLYNPIDPDIISAMEMARGCNNIFFVYEPYEMKKASIIANAVATLSVAAYTDSGGSTLESMSCGVPVIATRVGGHEEVVIEGKTGLFLDPAFTVYNLMEAVKAMTPDVSLSMKDACIQEARKYNLEVFTEAIHSYF